MFAKALESLRELSDALLYQQTKEDSPQVRFNIDDVVMDVENLIVEIQLLEKICNTGDVNEQAR